MEAVLLDLLREARLCGHSVYGPREDPLGSMPKNSFQIF